MDEVVAVDDETTVNDKTHIETGNSELNQLMNGDIFYEKGITSNKPWNSNFEFKDNVIKNLNGSTRKSNYTFIDGSHNFDDRNVNTNIGNMETIIKGINMDVYPKAIHEFYNYSVEAIYHLFEVAAGFVFDTYKNFIEVKSYISSQNLEKFLNSDNENFISSFGIDNILPYNDIKGTYSEQNKDVRSGSFPEFSKFLEKIKILKGGIPGYATLNPDEYVNIIAAIRKELFVPYEADEAENPIIKLDIQNNPMDLTVMKSTNRFVSDDVAVQIVPYLINILFDTADSSKNGVPVVAYNVYISFDSICDSIISAIKWDNEICNIENRQEFVDAVLNAKFISKSKLHEKIANSISLFLFNNIHKIHGTFNDFLKLSENYYEKLSESDPDMKNIVTKLRYCLSNTTESNVDQILKDSITLSMKHYNTFTMRPESAVDIINRIAENSNNKEQLDQLVAAILSRAFSMLNEDSFVVNAWDDVISTTEYKANDMIESINGVDDYFCKDFFTTLFNTIKVSSLNKDGFNYLRDNRKTGLDGELILNKYNRSTHHFYIILAVTINVYGNAMLTLRSMNINGYDIKMQAIINKLMFKISDTFSIILKDSIQYLTHAYLNPSYIAASKGYYDAKIRTDYKINSYFINHINGMVSLFKSCYLIRNNFSESGISEALEKLAKAMKFKITPSNSWRSNGLIASFNTPEIIECFRPSNRENIDPRVPTMGSISELNTTIYRNFVKSGLVSLENSPEFI